MTEYLTKSSLAELEQCALRFWLSRHRPELAGEAEAGVVVDGHRVGALARALIPDGVLVNERDVETALTKTSSLIRSGDRPIFEGAFAYGGVLVRTDILIPTGSSWRLAEVKSSSKPKSHHIADLSTQLWVVRGAGVPISSAVVRHINTDFVYRGTGEYAGILKDSDVGEPLDAALEARPTLVEEALAVSVGDRPQIGPGDHCHSPFDCPFTAHCTSSSPATPEFPVTLLPGPRGKAAGRRLAEEGYEDLRSVPDGILEEPVLQRILEVTRTRTPYHDRAAFRLAVEAWGGPRYYLDFETIGLVIPAWVGMRPYQSLPFQFSCHVEAEDGTITHSEFLDVSGGDPSRSCAEALIAALGDSGPIITYNLPTERVGLRALANRCPELAPQLEKLADRLVDLLPLVRSHYYHPAMKGSYSIKSVLPAALVGLSYKDLEIQDGRAAQSAWLAAIDPQAKPDARAALREAMLRYCERDTWAMVELIRALVEREETA